MLHSQGKSQREIAEQLSLSKTTVNKYLNAIQEELESKLLSGSRPSQFCIASDFIKEKLTNYPCLRTTKLYRLVKEQYPEITSKRRALYNYVQKLRKEIVPSPRRNYQPIIDHRPGCQVQVDPGECYVHSSIDQKYKVYFVAFVYSYSRKKYIHFQLQPYKTEDFIKAHLEAFQYFGALAEEYVYDQTKLVVIQEKYREVWFNEKFHKFAMQNGFKPRVCEGYDPESKGKVERVVREVKEDFFYGSQFKDIDEIRHQSFEWLNRVNNVKHTTTGKEPDLLFEDELKVMTLWHRSSTEIRKADKVGLISYKGNKYSVPMPYQRRNVYIAQEGSKLLILNENSLQIAQHDISSGKNMIIKNNNHYRDFNRVLAELEAEAKEIFSCYEKGVVLVEKLIKDNPKIPRDQLRGLMKLYRKNKEMEWQQIINKSLLLNHIRTSRIEQILREIRKFNLLQEIEFSARQSAQTPDVTSAIQRSLDKYMEVFNDK